MTFSFVNSWYGEADLLKQMKISQLMLAVYTLNTQACAKNMWFVFHTIG